MYEYMANIVSVHDADTITVDVDLGFHVHFTIPLRLYGINAPELSTPEGKAARDWLQAQLPTGYPVRIETIKDRKEKYGRYLAVIFDGQRNFNDELVANNMATVYYGGAR